MKTEITVTDEDDLPPDDEFADQWNTILALEVRIDLLNMSRADNPEDFLDPFFLEIKQQCLNHFYHRYPERIPNAHS